MAEDDRASSEWGCLGVSLRFGYALGGRLMWLFSPSASAQFDMNGRTYRMEELIGEGGFSYVYRVVELESGRAFALKKILAQDQETLRSGHAEIEVFQEVHHANVLSLVDHSVVDVPDRPGAQEVLMLLPLSTTGTLQDALDATRSSDKSSEAGDALFFGELEALQIFVGVCRGVLSFHEHEPPLAHNDIKPSNVLLNDDASPLLMDFGSTRPARRALHSRSDALALQEWASINCTMPFRSPELFDPASDAVLDERTDVWSLGCLLYALLHGQSPFAVSDGGSVAIAVASGKVPFPKSARLYSDGVRSLILAMLAADISQRCFLRGATQRAEMLRSQLEERSSS